MNELKRSEAMTVRELVSPTTRLASVRMREPSQSEKPRAVLAELFELVEEYGPLWYTEDLHNRAVSALSKVDSPVRRHSAR